MAHPERDILDGLEAIQFGTGSVYYPNFLKNLGIDADELFLFMMEDQFIDRGEDFMKYRGNKLARSKKFWMKCRLATGALIYGYPGFQYESVLRYLCYKDVPHLDKLVALFGKLGFEYNHIIGTKYETGSDNIGFHSDKTDSWEPNSSVAILSLGATREFQFMKITEDPQESDLLRLWFTHGSCCIISWEDNLANKHSIPPVEYCELRVSLCFRNIKHFISKAKLDQKIRASQKSREERKLKKQRRIESSSAEITPTIVSI